MPRRSDFRVVGSCRVLDESRRLYGHIIDAQVADSSRGSGRLHCLGAAERTRRARRAALRPRDRLESRAGRRIGRCATPRTTPSACATCWSRSATSRRIASSSCAIRIPPMSASTLRELAQTAHEQHRGHARLRLLLRPRRRRAPAPPRRAAVAQRAAGHAAQPARDDQARRDRRLQVRRGHAQGRRARRRVRCQRRQSEALGHGDPDEQRRRRAVAGVARARRLGVHASPRVGSARRGGRGRRQQVTVSEAYHYAYARTRADTATSGTPQRPAFRYELSGQGELVLTQLATPHIAQMTVPRGAEQKYVVLDQHEWRLIAEATREQDRDVTLALAPGNYRVKRVLTRSSRGRLARAHRRPARGRRSRALRVRAAVGAASSRAIRAISAREHREWLRAPGVRPARRWPGRAALADLRSPALPRARRPAVVARSRPRARAARRGVPARQRSSERATTRSPTRSRPIHRSARIRCSRSGTSGSASSTRARRPARTRPGSSSRRSATNPRTVQEVRRRLRLSQRARLVHGRPRRSSSSACCFRASRIDFGEPGLDASVVIAPYASRWSPYLGFGGHMSARRWASTSATVRARSPRMAAMYNYRRHVGRCTARVEVGAQYVCATRLHDRARPRDDRVCRQTTTRSPSRCGRCSTSAGCGDRS